MSERSASRYDAFIATFVGILALCVSGYTAHIQRQQVRAQVWPYLEIGSSNMPTLTFALMNKGVGPAIVRDVRVTVDGQPYRSWREVWKHFGESGNNVMQSQLNGRVLSPDETVVYSQPLDDAGRPLPPGKASQARRDQLSQLGIEICYCSTLGECWRYYSAPADQPDTRTEVGRCPAPGADSFRQ